MFLLIGFGYLFYFALWLVWQALYWTAIAVWYGTIAVISFFAWISLAIWEKSHPE